MRGFVVLSILYFMVNIANAQTNGNISGCIIDLQTKPPLPGANVLVVGTDRGAATDESGNFFISNMEEDIYKIRVSYIGYQEHVETNVRVVRGKTILVEDIEAGAFGGIKRWSLSAKWRYATGRPTDSFVVYNDIFNNPNFVRYSKEITKNNGDRLPAFHTFNIRADYRKQLGRIEQVSFFDIVNLYSRLNVNEARFVSLTGKIEERGFEILPTMGLKLEL